MSDQEKFLTRWSRRKLEPADEKVPAATPHSANVPPVGKEAAKAAGAMPAQQAEAAPQPEFDLSKLPSLDSIDAASDIRAFLQAGVPSALKHAALRRAWSADPAIRDYIGPNENFWDATGVDNAPGFGSLDPSVDVKKLVADIFRDAAPEAESHADAQASGQSDIAANESVPLEPQQVMAAKSDPSLQCDENIAPQQADLTEEKANTTARRHGGALPS